MKVIEIKRLRPTQATHGRREVQQKTGEYVALEGHDLDMAIASKPIPVSSLVPAGMYSRLTIITSPRHFGLRK